MSGTRIGLGAVCLAVGLTLALAASVEAQVPPSRPIPTDLPTVSTLDVSLVGGVLAPLSQLTRSSQSFATTVSSSPLVGGAVTWWPARRWGVGVEGAYAFADLHTSETEFAGAIPTDLGSARWMSGTVNILHRFLFSGAASVVEPYVSVGGGVRHLSVDEIAEPEVTDATDPLANLAGGVSMAFAPRLSLRAEVRNRLSAYQAPRTGDRRVQNDITVTLGVAARIR